MRASHCSTDAIVCTWCPLFCVSVTNSHSLVLCSSIVDCIVAQQMSDNRCCCGADSQTGSQRPPREDQPRQRLVIHHKSDRNVLLHWPHATSGMASQVYTVKLQGLLARTRSCSKCSMMVTCDCSELVCIVITNAAVLGVEHASLRLGYSSSNFMQLD